MNWNEVAGEVLAVADLVVGSMREDIEAVAAEMAACVRAGNKVMFCGNGGSAADAQHLAAELVNRFLLERRPYAGLALSTDTSILTSIGNDYSFDEIFSKQVQALGKKGDMLFGISTSGNAKNVLRAFEAARAIGVTTVALTGGSGGKIVSLSDRMLAIDCTKSTPRIQEGHLLVMHALCQLMEEQLEGRS